MNDTLHWCDDKDTLIDYLYGELEAEAKRVFEGHLRTCRACAHDVDELRGARTELAAWQLPEAALGFTAEAVRAAVPPPAFPLTATVLQPPRWAFAQVPVWARAAAAVLVVGAGLGLANVRVQYGAAGLQVSTGWMAPALATATAPAAAASNTGWRPDLAALEADLRREMQTLRASNTAAATAPAAAVTPVVARAGGEEQAILRRVQSLIQESERRQQQDLALRLRQLGSDVEMQRRADLVRLEQGFDRFQGRSGAAIAQQQRVLDLLVRASTTKVP